jgi:DNA-binding winged helix-turn-helix (wHTH) protein/TolB-like protein/Tfp pilus assembly protein PilF
LNARRRQFGDFSLFPEDQVLLRGSDPVALAPKLFDLLVFMVEHHGRLLTRDELMKAVWPDTVVEENNLTVNISLLRKILGDAPDGKPYIQTVPRRGYRFHANVVQCEQSGDSGDQSSSESRGTLVLSTVATAPGGPTGRRRALTTPMAWIVAGICLGLAVYFGRLAARHPPPVANAVSPPRNLAVLPFRNLRQSPADDFLGFALADAIITKLGYVSRLSVRPSSAVARFDAATLDLPKVAEELKVDTLLTGTYVHDGDDLRLRAQLVDAATQRLLWSDSVTLNYMNLLSVQDRVAQEIVSGLEVPLSAPEAARLAETRPASADAYEQYLKGVDLYALNRFEQSIGALELSARLDSDYPPTWAMLGRAYTTEASLQFGGARDYGKALDAYQKALHWDPAQIEPRVFMANLFTDTGRVEDAVPLLKDALTVNPNHAEALWELSYAYRFAGLLAQSIASAERARQLDPSVKLTSSAINAYLYLGRYEDFLNRLPSREAGGYIVFYRGFAEYHLGRLAEARQDFDRAYELDASLLQTRLGKALSDKLRGDVESASAALRAVEQQLVTSGVTDGEATYKIAQGYAQLGDAPAALRVLEKSVSEGFFCYPYLLRDPLLDSIRSSAGFGRILDKARVRYEAFKARFDRDFVSDGSRVGFTESPDGTRREWSTEYEAIHASLQARPDLTRRPGPGPRAGGGGT